jgi:hypothetical protein
LRRIALLVSDNANAARVMVKNLETDYPGARVDCLVTNTSPELLVEELPNRQVRTIDSLARRVALAARLAFAYDAVAIPSNQPRYLFTRPAKYVLHFTDQKNYRTASRNLTAVLGAIAGRPLLYLRAATLAARAASMRPLDVNYHFWRK